MAIVSRLELNHPALGTAGGSALHASIEAIYKKLGDMMNSRFFALANLNDTESVDVDHNFQTSFDDLRIDLYLLDEVTGELTRVTNLTGYTIAAKVGAETTQITVTNNTGSQKDLALVVIQDPINLDELVDVDAPSPEDGQAMVWDATAAKWKPGASGDASFKIQGVTDPNATIKGGFMMLPDGRELASYDGAGSASTDFGKDLTVSLDTILGANPANATAYYLAIDLLTLGAAVVQTDTGRKVYPITEANFVLTTTTPEAANRNRYIFRSVIRSADSGTVWSGTGAKFATLAFLKGEVAQAAQNPLVFSVAQQTVGSVGATNQIRQGHVLVEKSFPAAARDTAKLSFWNLANALTDGYGGARALSAANAPGYTTGLFNVANEAIALVGASSQRLYSADTFFQPFGAGSFAVGGWFKPTAVASQQGLISRYVGAGNRRQYDIYINPTGNLICETSSDGTITTTVVLATVPVTAGQWLHVALVWTGTEVIFFHNGKRVAARDQSAFGNVAPEFAVGAENNTSYFTGTVEEVFYVKGVVLTDVEIAKLASTKLSHNKAMSASRQLWLGRHYAAGSAPVSDLSGFVLDMADANDAFVDLSGCDPTDKVDLMLLDTGAAGAISVPVQTPEFVLTANIPGAGLDTNLAEAPRSIQGWQLDNDSHWQPLDLVGLVYVDQADGMKLKGDISSLTPSSGNPVRIVVSTTASAQAVGVAAVGINGMVNNAGSGGTPIKGATDGSSATAGYVGEEKIDYSSDSVSTVTADTEITTGASITLSAGSWDLSYSATILLNRISGTSAIGRVRVIEGASTIVSNTEKSIGVDGSVVILWADVSMTKRIEITSEKTYTLKITCDQSDAVAVAQVRNGNLTSSISGSEATTYIRAVRLR